MRATTWSGTKRVSVTDETNQSTELSPSAKPVAPTETALLPNYPNPFNPETWIPYHLADDAKVTLNVYDAKGCWCGNWIWGINQRDSTPSEVMRHIGTDAITKGRR